MRSSVLALSVLLLPACSKSTPTSGAGTETTPASAKAPASAAPSAPAVALPSSIAPAASSAVAPPPTCLLKSQKIWAKHPNKLTGLTVAELKDGRAAIGLALGNTPHVLVVGNNGEGSLKKVAMAGEIAKELKPAEGTRHLLRVTPIKAEGDDMKAFVDYRDELKDKRRRVFCGPAHKEDPWMGFTGESLYEQKEKDRPTGADLAAKFKTKSPDGKERYREMRDCRTFADTDAGEAWVVGSELRGELKDDKPQWSMHLTAVDRACRGNERSLHESTVKDGQAKPTAYEVPQSARLVDGTFVVVARHGAQLLGAFMNADKTRKGETQTYDGFPTLPDIARDDRDTVITSAFGRAKGQYEMRGIRLAADKPEFPKHMHKVVIDDDDEDSEEDPDFTRDSRGRRWLSYIDGERGKGHLLIGPVDEKFRFIGRPYAVTEGEERASEARLVPIKDGAILVVYIREMNGTSELVTEDLMCTISK